MDIMDFFPGPMGIFHSGSCVVCVYGATRKKSIYGIKGKDPGCPGKSIGCSGKRSYMSRKKFSGIQEKE